MKTEYVNDLYYGDIAEDMVLTTPTRTISESDIMLFAGLTGDFNELHTSAVFAEKTVYGQRIAHGMLTLSMANGLYMRMGCFNRSTIANLGIKEWRFVKPVLIGDTLYVRITLAEKHLTSNAEKGVVNWNVEVLNQRNDAVAKGIWTKMIANPQP